MGKNELQVITYNGERVLTTSRLAEQYETTDRRISENFNANKGRYIEGKHYYYLKGEELNNFLQYGNSVSQKTNKIRTLYLWTDKGALLHAKSLNTDKAWQVYEFLLDNYFKIRDNPPLSSQEIQFFPPKATSVGEVASIIKTLQSVMKHQNSHPVKIAVMAEGLCHQFGINIPDDFVERSPWEQIELAI